MEDTPIPDTEQITAEPKDINQVSRPSIVEHIKQEQGTCHNFLNENIAYNVSDTAVIKQEIKTEMEDTPDAYTYIEYKNYSIKEDNKRNVSVISDVEDVSKSSVDEYSCNEISYDEKCNSDNEEKLNHIVPTEYINVKEELRDTDDDFEEEIVDEKYM